MPFRRITFDSNGQAGTSIPRLQRVYVLNDSGNPITIVDGSANFVLQANTYAKWTPDELQLSFTGTSGTTFLFAWGDFKIDPMPGYGAAGQKVVLYDSTFTNPAAVKNTTPLAADYGLVVRQNGVVSVTNSTVIANQG